MTERARRYLSRWYVALTRGDAERHAQIDGGPIRVADAEIVHATREWTLWSDGWLTTSVGLPRWAQEIRSLSRDAENLVGECRGSDSGPPAVGYALLVQVAVVLRTETVVCGAQRGVYRAATIDRLAVQMLDGSERELVRYSEGYPEGYLCEIYETLEALQAAHRRASTRTSAAARCAATGPRQAVSA